MVDALGEDNAALVRADTRRKMASVIEATRSTLGAVRYEATWAEGRGLTLEQTIALAEDQVR